MQYRIHINYLAILILTIMVMAMGTIMSAAQDNTVSIQLGWIFDYSSSPFYMAQQYGYFTEAGLDIELVEGGFKDGVYVDGLAALLDGSAQFAATDSSQLLLARAEGKPLVAVAVLAQRSPFAIISLSEDNITRPQDLVGKTVTITEGGNWTILEELLLDQGIDPDTVTIVPRTGFGIDPLVNGEVDALGGWIINEGLLVKDAGFEPNYILFSDYAMETYVSLYVTTEDMIAEHPDIVAGFVQGFVRGLQDVIDDPESAAEATLAYNSELDLNDQMERIQTFLPLINPAGSSPGMMDGLVFEFNQDILLKAGLLTSDVDIDSAYTLAFLNEFYQDQ